MRAVALLALFLPSVALADAIDMPPENCPPGSSGESSHAGTWCEARTCADDGSCEEGSCRPVGLCVLTEERACGGRQADTDAPCTFTANEALGTCDGPDDCERGTCVVADRCVRGGPFGAASCGCASVPSNRLALFVGVAGLVGLGVVGRRRAAAR